MISSKGIPQVTGVFRSSIGSRLTLRLFDILPNSLDILHKLRKDCVVGREAGVLYAVAEVIVIRVLQFKKIIRRLKPLQNSDGFADFVDLRAALLILGRFDNNPYQRPILQRLFLAKQNGIYFLEFNPFHCVAFLPGRFRHAPAGAFQFYPSALASIM